MAQSGGSGNTGVSLGLTTDSHETESDVDNLPSSGGSRTYGVPPQSGSTGASWVNVTAEERATRVQTNDLTRQGLGIAGSGGSSLRASDPYGKPPLTKSKVRAKSLDPGSLDKEFFGESRPVFSKHQIRAAINSAFAQGESQGVPQNQQRGSGQTTGCGPRRPCNTMIFDLPAKGLGTKAKPKRNTSRKPSSDKASSRGSSRQLSVTRRDDKLKTPSKQWSGSPVSSINLSPEHAASDHLAHHDKSMRVPTGGPMDTQRTCYPGLGRSVKEGYKEAIASPAARRTGTTAVHEMAPTEKYQSSSDSDEQMERGRPLPISTRETPSQRLPTPEGMPRGFVPLGIATPDTVAVPRAADPMEDISSGEDFTSLTIQAAVNVNNQYRVGLGDNAVAAGCMAIAHTGAAMQRQSEANIVGAAVLSQAMVDKDNLCRQMIGQTQQQAEAALLQQREVLTQHLAANQNLAAAEKRHLVDEANSCMTHQMSKSAAEYQAGMKAFEQQCEAKLKFAEQQMEAKLQLEKQVAIAAETQRTKSLAESNQAFLQQQAHQAQTALDRVSLERKAIAEHSNEVECDNAKKNKEIADLRDRLDKENRRWSETKEVKEVDSRESRRVAKQLELAEMRADEEQRIAKLKIVNSEMKATELSERLTETQIESDRALSAQRKEAAKALERVQAEHEQIQSILEGKYNGQREKVKTLKANAAAVSGGSSLAAVASQLQPAGEPRQQAAPKAATGSEKKKKGDPPGPPGPPGGGNPKGPPGGGNGSDEEEESFATALYPENSPCQNCKTLTKQVQLLSKQLEKVQSELAAATRQIAEITGEAAEAQAVRETAAAQERDNLTARFDRKRLRLTEYYEASAKNLNAKIEELTKKAITLEDMINSWNCYGQEQEESEESSCLNSSDDDWVPEHLKAEQKAEKAKDRLKTKPETVAPGETQARAEPVLPNASEANGSLPSAMAQGQFSMEQAVEIAAQAAANAAISCVSKKNRSGDDTAGTELKIRETDFKITYFPTPENCEQWLIDVETVVISNSGRADNRAGEWFARVGDLGVPSSELAEVPQEFVRMDRKLSAAVLELVRASLLKEMIHMEEQQRRLSKEPKLTGLEKVRMVVKHVQYAEGELTSFGWRDAMNMSWFGDTPLQVYRYIANMTRIWENINARPAQKMEMLQGHIENERTGIKVNSVLGKAYEAWKGQKRALDGTIRPEYSSQGILSLLEHYCIDETMKQNKKSREKTVKGYIDANTSGRGPAMPAEGKDAKAKAKANAKAKASEEQKAKETAAKAKTNETKDLRNAITGSISEAFNAAMPAFFGKGKGAGGPKGDSHKTDAKGGGKKGKIPEKFPPLVPQTAQYNKLTERREKIDGVFVEPCMKAMFGPGPTGSCTYEKCKRHHNKADFVFTDAEIKIIRMELDRKAKNLAHIIAERAKLPSKGAGTGRGAGDKGGKGSGKGKGKDRSTIPCLFFPTNTCTNGNNCPFKH